MPASDRPFSVVLKSVFENVEDIIRAELKLVVAQAREELASAARGAMWFAVGITSALAALAFILVAIFFALMPYMPHWAAALVVAAGMALISIVSFGIGAAKRRASHPSRPAPAERVAQQEELSWAKQQAR